jgi:hypothetical protein
LLSTSSLPPAAVEAEDAARAEGAHSEREHGVDEVIVHDPAVLSTAPGAGPSGVDDLAGLDCRLCLG